MTNYPQNTPTFATPTRTVHDRKACSAIPSPSTRPPWERGTAGARRVKTALTLCIHAGGRRRGSARLARGEGDAGGAQPSRSRSAPAGGAVTTTTSQPAPACYCPARAARPRRPGRADRPPCQALRPGLSSVLRQARLPYALHECRRGAVSVPPPASPAGGGALPSATE